MEESVQRRRRLSLENDLSGSAEGSVLGRESVFPPLVPVLLACAVSLLGHINFSFLCGENE